MPVSDPQPKTPDQFAAEKIGRAIDGQILRLQDEKAALLLAPTRIGEIDAEIAILASEKQKIDPRRPPITAAVPADPKPIIVPAPKGKP